MHPQQYSTILFFWLTWLLWSPGEDGSAAPGSWIIKTLQAASCESYLNIVQLVRGTTSCILDNSQFDFLAIFFVKLLSELANLLYMFLYICACVFVPQRCLFAVHIHENPHCFIIVGYYHIDWLWFYPVALIGPSQRRIPSLCEKDS